MSTNHCPSIILNGIYSTFMTSPIEISGGFSGDIGLLKIVGFSEEGL